MKYIIESNDVIGYTPKYAMLFGDGYMIQRLEDLEELTADYINEHYGSLQDDAYKRGLEDGKAQSDRGCEGCRYSGTPKGDSPCFNCSNYYTNNWTAKQTDDEIKVGDEMRQVYESGAETGLLCTVTAIDGDCMSGFSQDGRAIVCSSQVNCWWKKTGRHFNVEEILEEMRE